jgi:hypothetical protein
LFIAYVLNPENIHTGKYILDAETSKFGDVVKWRSFRDFKPAAARVRTEEFNIPDSDELRFPLAVRAWESLKYLK